MELSTDQPRWTERDLLSLPNASGKHEVIDGELLVTPTSFGHEIVASCLIMELRLFAKEKGLGLVAGSSLGCWMSNGNLRSPDVSFVSKGRLGEIGQDMSGFLKGAPDLAVEIVSPSNTMEALRKKAAEYFESGCLLVWAVDPGARTVIALTHDSEERRFDEQDSIEGGHALPGFTLSVIKLFEDLP